MLCGGMFKQEAFAGGQLKVANILLAPGENGLLCKCYGKALRNWEELSWDSAHSLLTPSPRLCVVQARAGNLITPALAESWDRASSSWKGCGFESSPPHGQVISSPWMSPGMASSLAFKGS